MLPDEALHVVRTVVTLLARGEYEELETLTEGRRLTAGEMAGAIEEHGARLVVPPREAYADLEPVELATGPEVERALHVSVPLWTAQEGRSKLEARLVVAEVMEGVWTVDIAEIRAP
jgi:hypothetical protein